MYYVGLELGSPGQFTAISVVELMTWHFAHGWVSRPTLTSGERQETFRRLDGTWVDEGDAPILVRELTRLAPGTSYPEILDAVGRLFSDRRIAEETVAVVVDQSGVGRAVVDELRARNGVPYVKAVRLTAGGEVTEINGGYNVPKIDVAGVLRMALDKGLLRIGPVENREALQSELLNFTPKIKSGVDPTSIDWREGERDDLVLAVGIAAWYAKEYGEIRASTLIAFVEEDVRISPY